MTKTSFNPYQNIIANNICGDIKKAQKSGAIGGAVILTYSAIDAMAFLSMSLKQKEVTKKDYIAWVEKYMSTDENQDYQYRGIDLYGARCGIIHRYGVESRLSESGACKIFAYNNGSEHYFNPKINNSLVIISTIRLINDFMHGVKAFMADMRRDPRLKSRVDSRLCSLFMTSKRTNL